MELVAFVDDVLILIEGSSRRVLETTVDAVMRLVYEWGSQVGTEASDRKSVCMVSILLKGTLDPEGPLQYEG